MDYMPVTPFGRSVDAAILAHTAMVERELPPTGVNKWEVLRELSVSKHYFRLSDRDLTVLQALISFYQSTLIGGNEPNVVIHPSNKAICERLNGMPCSTMRRHLAKLVDSGLVIRKDSPNGKRYARRYGEEKVVFGFDLSPLVIRYDEICRAAEHKRKMDERYERLRVSVSLMKRDLTGIAEYGLTALPHIETWHEFLHLVKAISQELRRVIELDRLEELSDQLCAALERAQALLDDKFTEMSTKDAENDHLYQNSNTEINDFEPRSETAGAAPSHSNRSTSSENSRDDNLYSRSNEFKEKALPNLPIRLVLSTCTEFKSYIDFEVRHWHELVRAAELIRPHMGISPSAWFEAKECMGPEEAAIVVIAMLERFSEIRSPGGYLRTLTTKAATTGFSSGPMVMALMNRQAA